jgi:hypothetical protein
MQKPARRPWKPSGTPPSGSSARARRDLEVNPGTLTIRARATMRGQQAAVDALIEHIALGAAGEQ